jgi:predicted nucleic acid-binding protein
MSRTVFADSLYWIAMASPKDQWHAVAMASTRTLKSTQIVTTEEVLGEFLTAFRYNAPLRRLAARYVQGILANPLVTVMAQSAHSFRLGFDLYQARPDKEYSLIDCISMETMRTGKFTEILTHDAHFAQERFTLLL